MKILVTYFSASGVTRKAATRLSKLIHADLKEIEPKEIYTSEDLNYMNPNSRSSLEMKDISSRPALKNVLDVKEYDVIFVGFPVWWYREPTIIDSFLESVDLAGKTVVPFATSGGSSINNVKGNFEQIIPSAKVLPGRVIRSNESDDQISSWVNSLLK